jgi:hypothetical protein
MVTQNNVSRNGFHFYVTTPDIGHIGLCGEAIVCSNPDCNKVTVTAFVRQASRNSSGTAFFPMGAKVIERIRMMPDSMAKPQPDYIPFALREDYSEACRIRELSPKASATLARRCLQGMIRDFCGIKKSRLIDEIKALKEEVEKGNAPKGVSEESVEAIDHVRHVGNIGAHMEKDINLVVEVDPGEAQALIELIETLFDECYVQRHKREERLAKVKEISEGKKQQIEQLRNPQIEPPKEG